MPPLLQPHREPLRITLARNLTIASGGHWVDLFFLSWLRHRLPAAAGVQRASRIAIWFVGGIGLALGARVTATLLLSHPPARWPGWAVAGAGFVAIELIAHGVLHARGRPSFYNALG